MTGFKNALSWIRSGLDIYFTGGKVGIGTSTPVKDLDVIGDLQVSDAILGDGSKWITDPHEVTNVMIGQGAGSATAAHGVGNIGIGSLALEDIQVGAIHNIAIGQNAGKDIISSDYNILLGSNAGDALTNGYKNVAIGYSSLSSASGLAENISIGHDSMSNSSSNYSIGIGYQSLRASTGAYITSVGYQSGYSASGNYGTFIGVQAGRDETGSYKIIIDNRDRTSEALGRTLAPIYAVTDAVGANQTLQLGGGGAVSIGGSLSLTGEAYGFLVTKSYGFTSQGVGAGTYYVAGYYDAPAADANLDQGSLTQTLGSANGCYAAHAFIVAAAAGVTDGTDLILTVTGTSITDADVRNAGDSEVLVADGTTSAVNVYYETTKKWIGQITYTLSSTAGTAYNYDFNYGFCKYEDFGNHNFNVLGFEAVGSASATDASFNITLFKHCSSDWNYSAAAFEPTPTEIVDLQTVHNTEYSTISGDPFAFKRIPINTAVGGSGSEGVIIRVVTSQNNTVQSMDMHIGVKFTT